MEYSSEAILSILCLAGTYISFVRLYFGCVAWVGNTADPEKSQEASGWSYSTARNTTDLWAATYGCADRLEVEPRGVTEDAAETRFGYPVQLAAAEIRLSSFPPSLAFLRKHRGAKRNGQYLSFCRAVAGAAWPPSILQL